VAAGLAGAACAAGLGACGGSEEPPATVSQERPDRRAPLPPGWRLVVNPRAGFTLGLPPGWTAEGARGSTLVRSGDRLLAVSIGADRSSDGRNLPPATYARRTATQLPGYRGLRVGRPRALRGARYPAAEVSATGTFARTRVRQAIRVVAMRRNRQVTYSLLVFRTARAPESLYRAAIAGMIRTFRARPPQT
jgi:hypothetical protein